MVRRKNPEVKMYQYDDCSFCGGRVGEREVQKACFWGDRLVALVDHVPAGVCEQCGEKYYQAKVLKTIERILKTREKFFVEKVSIPRADFAIL